MAATKKRRSPVHLKQTGYTTDRDAMWEGMRVLRKFTRSQIEDYVNSKPGMHVSKSSITTYITGLTKAGYLKVSGKRQRGSEGFISLTWTLINDVGVDAPRVTKEGEPVVQGKAREQMWRTMRVLHDFDYQDLAIHASTEEQDVKGIDARDYIKHLLKAGYLIVIQKANTHGGAARYRLLPDMYTGPRPPMVQRIKQVFDPNLNQVMWPKPKEDDHESS